MSRRLQTDAAVTCMKLLLMIFNVIFWATGIIVLAFGVWMKLSLNQFLELSEDYNEAMPYVFIATGAVIVLVGFFACSCTIKGQSVLLYLLSIFLGIIFILEMTAGISGYIYRGNIEQGFKNGLQKSFQHYGSGGIQDKDVDMLQSLLHCCGVKSYVDWNKIWHNEYISVPLSCCRDKSDCNYSPVKNTTEIYTSGCYSKVVNFINHNIGIIGGGAVGFACLQLLGMILSCCLAKYSNKAKYESMG